MLFLENQNQSRTLSGLPLSRRLSIPGSPPEVRPQKFHPFLLPFFLGAFLRHDRMAKGIDPSAAAAAAAADATGQAGAGVVAVKLERRRRAITRGPSFSSAHFQPKATNVLTCRMQKRWSYQVQTFLFCALKKCGVQAVLNSEMHQQ